MVYRICFLPLPAALVVTYLPPEVIACLHCDILFSACGDIGCHSLLLKFQCFPDSRCLEALIFRSKKWHVMSLFSKKYFDLRNQHCFSYIMTAREEDYVACDATLFSWNFNCSENLRRWKHWFSVQKSGVLCYFFED